MTRLLLALAALALLASGCGGDDGPDVASDPGSVTPTVEPTPTDDPADGTYPGFAPTDYTYQLSVSCFCPDAGTPIAITVVDDEVTEAVLAVDGTGRGGGEKGDPAADYLRRTIDNLIDEANAARSAGAASVEVTWPDGQDYPTSIRIDQSTMMADEEVGYTISDVEVS